MCSAKNAIYQLDASLMSEVACFRSNVSPEFIDKQWYIHILAIFSFIINPKTAIWYTIGHDLN